MLKSDEKQNKKSGGDSKEKKKKEAKTDSNPDTTLGSSHNPPENTTVPLVSKYCWYHNFLNIISGCSYCHEIFKFCCSHLH